MKLTVVKITSADGKSARYETDQGEVWHSPYPPRDGPLREALEGWESERDREGRPNRPAPYVAKPAEVSVHPNDFLNRFTQAERIDIRRASRLPGGEVLEDWIDHLRTASRVGLSDPRTIAGMQALVDASLISGDRRDAILS